MATFSKTSMERLLSCDVSLQQLFSRVVINYDCAILCGYRGKEEQDKAVANGASKTPWPTSKHNSIPSMAIDVAPYPIDYSDKRKVMARWYHFAGYVLRVAEELGITIRWGGDWDSDKIFDDQNFDDLPHFEVVL